MKMLPTIKQGMNSTDVHVAQLMLGYEPADGEFTQEFAKFVKDWQGRVELDADGVIGDKSWAFIAKHAPTVSSAKHRYGEYAMAVQLLVGCKADGIYGPKTKAAVLAYQASAGLKSDGICGPNTWGSLICGSTEPVVDNKQPPDFKQYDKRWATKMYSNHGDAKQTMKSSACGPTSMADIVAEWWDKNITPYDLAVKSMKWGTRTYDSGTTGTFFKKCADLYHASKYVTTSSIETAIKCLQSGGYVVVCFGKSKWTSGGHYCCMWKYDGKHFYINDPASAKASRAKGTYDEVKAARKGFYCFWG